MTYRSPVHFGRFPSGLRSRSQGAALLAAMLTVTLVATFAASALWQQWRGVEVETAERARVQSAWILIGALDWSRLILIEDHNAGVRTADPSDHLAEPWAVPLEEARLSTFLAADRNVVQQDDNAGSDTSDAFLSGQIIDLQSRLNLATLVNGSADTQEVHDQFARLFARLGLAPAQLDALSAALRQAQPPGDGESKGQGHDSGSGGGGGNAPLMPQTLEQLTWLGLPPATVAALAPYATLLPDPATRLNLNTADATVLMAGIEGLDEAGANKLIAVRQLQHFRNLEDARALLGNSSAQLTEGLHDTRSSYFEVRGRLRLGDVTVHERSLVHRVGRTVTTLERERGAAVLASAAPGLAP